MIEFGLWTENDGGLVETQLWGQEAAEARMAELVAEDPENADDLSIVAVCPEHGEQPAEACEECDADDDEGR